MRSTDTQALPQQAQETDEIDEAMLQELWMMSCDDLYMRLLRSASTDRTAGRGQGWLGLAEVA